ncbi:hypothetical protein BD779DRAFT_1001705 [Infundibulicybe gibba]|nr:hypothetical protein BD779DRAFT_1001705 [Infundibulicybe gibba]
MTNMISQSHSAIMHLPVDVIREIFLQCLLEPCRLPPIPTEPRLVLTHVCSAWREVALGTRKLWVDIIVYLEYFRFSEVHGHSIISTWLSRSFPCPISILVQCRPHTLRVFTNLILPNLHRCRQLELGTTGPELRQLLLLPVGTLADLEDIELYGTIESGAGADLFNHKQITVFQGCPKLHRANLSISLDTGPRIDLRRLGLPWGQLSVLHLKWVSAIFCLDILQECVSLQKCSLSIDRIDNVSVNELHALSKQPLLLPSIHSLSLTLTNHHTHFLAALHMANLREFCPGGLWYDFRWPSSSLESFLRLDKLNLSHSGVTMDNDLWEFLRPLQWLTKLHLPRMYLLTSATLQRFGSGALIPSVTSIHFGSIEIEGFISLLEERLATSRAVGSGISMFTYVSSFYPRPTEPRLVPRLKALEVAGMRVEFSPSMNRRVE